MEMAYLRLFILGIFSVQNVHSALISEKKWLVDLPDSQKINTLAFIGTHDSAASGTYLIDYAKTQRIGITAQLEGGIRVFDMRVRRTSDVFAMHHDLIYLGLMFGDIVQVNDYLKINPKEFVIMLMQEEYTAEGSAMSACQILENRYIKNWPNLFVQYWSIEDTIGQHRGKILLARGNRGFWGCVTQLPCKEQNNYELKSGYWKSEKMRDIKALQAEVSATEHNYQCYINYLSANGGFFSSPLEIAQYEWYPYVFSNPIVGMNDSMVSEFRNPKNTLYIVMADYPSQSLIDKVIDSNKYNNKYFYCLVKTILNDPCDFN